jgi:hypothetical protein
VVDATSVYWVDNGPTGPVMKVGIGGGTPTTLASGQLEAASIAVDATSVYWTDEGTYPSYTDGSIVKTAK